MPLLKIIARIFLFCLLPVFTYAQTAQQAPDPERFSSKELKMVEKSKTMYNKDKYDKAISLIAAPQSTHLLNGELWKLRVIYENARYQQHYQQDMATILKSLMSGKNKIVITYPVYETRLLEACFYATLYSKDQEFASMIVRSHLVDFNPDTAISASAKKAFKEGEEAFGNEKFDQAAKAYKRAAAEDSTYYKAVLYVGDAYFNDKEYEEALPWYKKAVGMQPKLQEGWKYLTDVYSKLHRYKEAYDACVEGIILYPDIGMFIKLEDICENMDKKFDRHWMPRMVYPNKAGADQSVETAAPWKFYREAKAQVKTDDNGILKTEEEGTKYLEVFSWAHMLKKSAGRDDELTYAKKMQEAGYLDCYVFISLFHYSCYDQYADFSSNNHERIKTYIKTYLVK
jgi:tetratricopeptide (TPR) repeat protein